MRCNFFSNFLRVTFERKVLRLTNTVSRFAGDYSSRVSGKGEDDVGGEIGKEKRTEGKGPWLGSPRHWGPGRDGIHRLAVLVYRGSLRSSYYAPLLVPHLARQTLLSFLPPPPASVAWTTRGLFLSLSHADPLERTRFYLSLSPVNGLCRPAPRFSIVFLSLSIFLSFGFTFSPLIIARLRS